MVTADLPAAAPCLGLALLAVVLAASSAVAGNTRQCSDPCIQAARAAYRDCASSAGGAFSDALDGCLGRDRTCIDACRTDRQDCREATSLGQDLATCQLELEASKDECRNAFPPGSKRRAACLDRAEVAHFRCRRGAVSGALAALKACGSGFDACAASCGPGQPPGGVDSCKAQGKSAVVDALRQCKVTRVVTVSACVNKDSTCVLDCSDARDICNAPTQNILAGAIASCHAQRRAALTACQAGNPGGGAALEACVDAAQANAFTCRDAALEASLPGLASCTASYAGCVRACPAP
jgi:hypothetical protein